MDDSSIKLRSDASFTPTDRLGIGLQRGGVIPRMHGL